MKTNDAAFRDVRRSRDIHRILRNENFSVGRACHNGGMFDLGSFGNQLDFPIWSCLGKFAGGKDHDSETDKCADAIPKWHDKGMSEPRAA